MQQTKMVGQATLFFFLVFIVFLVSSPVARTESEITVQKTFEEFATLLESNDYWFRVASSSEAGTQEIGELLLEGFQKISLNYGHRGPESLHHGIALLELQFKNRADIPLANEKGVQEYTVGWNLISPNGIHRPALFPLWQYKILDPVRLNVGESGKYVRWFAVRYGKKVLVLYDNRTGRFHESVPLLKSYVTMNTEMQKSALIARLQASKARSPVAYDAVEFLQSRLKELGYNPGPVDGMYGRSTEEALAAFLVRMGYLKADVLLDNDALSENIQQAVGLYQRAVGLPVTGQCDSLTVFSFEAGN